MTKTGKSLKSKVKFLKIERQTTYFTERAYEKSFKQMKHKSVNFYKILHQLP